MNTKYSILNLKTISIIFFFLTFLAVNPHTAHAQQVTLSINPPIVQAKIKPGKSILIAYTVNNEGDPIDLQFLIRPFIPVGQKGSLALKQQMEGPVQFNLENADVVLEKPFFFGSHEKKQAVVRVYIPPGVPDGDYYYMILAETVPAFSVGGQSTGVASASLGSPLLVTISESGVTEIKATIADFSFQPDYTFTIGNKVVRIVDNNKDLPVVCSVRNMGINLIQPNGTITDQFGNKKKEYAIVPQNILSTSQRIIKVVGEEGNMSSDSTMTLSHLGIGAHTITVRLSFGNNNSIQYKEMSFIALPIQLIVIFMVVLIIVGVFFCIRLIQRKKFTHQ